MKFSMKKLFTGACMTAFALGIWLMVPTTADAATATAVAPSSYPAWDMTTRTYVNKILNPYANLQDAAHHQLYTDEACTVAAKASDYEEGKLFYYKDATTTTTTTTTTAATTTIAANNASTVTNPFAAALQAKQAYAASAASANPWTATVAASGQTAGSAWANLLAQRQAAIANILASRFSGQTVSANCIDVSKYQGSINWYQVKSSGVNTAYVRCGGRYRDSRAIYTDETFLTNARNAASAGLAVGTYFYSTATNTAEAAQEAAAAVSLARTAGTISRPIYIDMEDKTQSGLSTAERTAICQTFCNTVLASGYSTGVYANYKWWTTMLDYNALSGYNVWVARYNSQHGWTGKINIWQYSSSGSVSGISGRVDMDIAY